MYVIVTYDIGEERLNKVRKVLIKYFSWVQNSVFEGEITESKFEKCKYELKRVIDESYDSVYFYVFESKKLCNKIVLGEGNDLSSSLI